MQLYGPFGGAKVRPGEETQTEIYRGGVECIDRLVEFDVQLVAAVEAASFGDQNLGKLGIRPPVPLLVRIGKCAVGYWTAEPEMVESVWNGALARLDVAQTLAVRELGKYHREELIPEGEAAAPVPAAVLLDTTLKSPVRGKLD